MPARLFCNLGLHRLCKIAATKEETNPLVTGSKRRRDKNRNAEAIKDKTDAELGYAILTREQADCIFQIISKRTEIGATIVTTDLIPSLWGKIFDTVTAAATPDKQVEKGVFRRLMSA